MPVDRLLPSDDAEDLIALTRDIADKVLDPIVDAHEKAETYPEGVFAQLGAAGLLSLPQPEEWGGGGQPYEVYLQVLEEIAARWAAVAVAVSVHSLSSHPLLAFGTDEQKQRWLPGMLSGEQIGAYSLSEPQAGSDAAALRCAATTADGGGYVINGSKSWITHGGRGRLLHAVRPHRRRSPRHLLLPGSRRPARAVVRQARGEDGPARGPDHVGVLRQRAASTPTAASAPRARVCRSRSAHWIPAGWASPPSPSGIAQAALDEAAAYANERTTFGRKIIDHQGLGFLLADMAAAVGQRARHLSRRRAPPRRWAGRTRRRPAWPS